ncbi:MAG: Hpt domain-containing protein [Pseudobacteriovorax sp.]|nr:Hpt domain-containing protein [Pseudobacteriovorax sp.]
MEMLFLSFALGARINLIKAQKLKAEKKMLAEAEEKKRLQAELIDTQKRNIETLDAKVKEKTKDIRDILVHIHQGIFTLDPSLNLGDEFSDYLVDILKNENLSGKNIQEILLDKSSLEEDMKSQIMTALDFSFGEDRELGWDANQYNLETELNLTIAEQDLIVEVDWWPIENDNGEVAKVLVTLRDVTEIRKLQATAKENEVRGRMLLEMLSNDLEKTQKFLARTLKAWREIDDILVQYLNDVDTNYDVLFRAYHTIKGNARSLEFKGISSSVHELETQLKEIKKEYTPDKLEKLRSDSTETHQLIRNYNKVFDEKFARLMGKDEAIKGQLFEYFVEKNIAPSLGKISKEVGKPEPVVKVNNPNGFLIMNDEMEDIIENILNHMMRNSIDHGLESPSDRETKGKKPWGTISIDISIDQQKNVTFRFEDDGKGLNLTKIYAIAVSKNLMDEHATAEQLVDVIFRPGFSTAEKTTMISGRGVGMDAVRHYSMSLGASFSLVPKNTIDDETLQRIKDGTGEDVYLLFEFVCVASLKPELQAAS